MEKTVNYRYVCFNVKHPEFAPNKRRKQKFIDEFWLYHQYQSEYQIPNKNNLNTNKKNSISDV